MNFGDIVGQLVSQGMSGATQGRVEHALGAGGLGGLLGGGQSGAQGGGLGDMLGGLLGGGPGGSTARGQAGGGLQEMLGGLLGGGQGGVGQGGMSNAQVGGIGALAGALLGGGGGAVKGALGGSAMAVLGSLALSALQSWQQGQAAGTGSSTGLAESGPPPQVSRQEMEQMVAPETAELCLKGMISAAKADGSIQDDELQRIVGKLEEGGITEAERRFVLDEMSRPLDLAGLVRAIPNRQVGAQVYAASLLAITVDTPNERTYMQQLAQGLGLDGATVGRLHQMVGAPAI